MNPPAGAPKPTGRQRLFLLCAAALVFLPGASWAEFPRPMRQIPPGTASKLPGNEAVRIDKKPALPERALDRAYDALLAGRLDEARQAYERALRENPKDAAVLLGLAAVAVRQGKNGQARDYYRRLLAVDPADATARAGLLDVSGEDPERAAEHLQATLSRLPEAAALHFVLGNLYARQNRWREAQQAYFVACSSEPDNADFLFNLAVSLDHLRQARLAAQYYRKALSAVDGGTPAFDPAQADARIRELEPGAAQTPATTP